MEENFERLHCLGWGLGLHLVSLKIYREKLWYFYTVDLLKDINVKVSDLLALINCLLNLFWN